MKFETQLSQISQDLKTCHLPISTQLKVAIDELIKFNEEQHVITRSQAKTSITDAMQGLKNSQDQHYGKQEQENRRQQQRERFLDSLTFEEINRRSNEVSPSYPETFEWIFDDDGTYRWDSFAKWLKGPEKVYWINGKAGSGKSTLIKFIANDVRTKDALEQWSPDNEVLIVTFFLWLSGTRMQRSLKGLLCSVARQIVRSDEDLPTKLICIDDKLLLKRSVDDWSCEELHQLLRTLLRLLSRPVCIFVDGLDEFDQGDDIEELLDLIQELSMTINVKVCVSSRPENYLEKRLSQYRQVRLQDLTAQDIEICIREKLEEVRKKCSLASFDQEHLDGVVEVIKEKSDGVFLWVHYAINTTLRGMRNGDDFGVLLARVESLPGEMHELYLQMWKRLNGDDQFYSDEAATYFSYDSHYPLSLFELMVALDESLQADYMNNVGPLDPDDLARGCEVLKTRILTRCAGLLEVVDEEDYFSDQKSLDQGSEDMQSDDQTSLDQDPEDMQGNVNLWRYHDTKIKFLHRTARDFLLTTTNGQDLLGKPNKSIESRFLNVIKAKLATSIQGLREFDCGFMTSLIDSIAAFDPEKNEVELLLTIKRVYEKVSMPEEMQHVGNNAFWSRSWAENFETLAASFGCTKYICHFLENERPQASSAYRSRLFLFAAEGLYIQTSSSFSLIRRLSLLGVDFYTNQDFGGALVNPASYVLLGILACKIHFDERLEKQASETIQELAPFLSDSAAVCLVGLSRENGWQLDQVSPSRWRYHAIGIHVVVQMSVAKLYFLVMQFFSEHASFKPQWRYVLVQLPPIKLQSFAIGCVADLIFFSLPLIHEENITEVLFCFWDEMNENENEFEMQGVRPTGKDPIYLGQAVDRILLWDETSPTPMCSLMEELDSRLKEVRQMGNISSCRR